MNSHLDDIVTWMSDGLHSIVIGRSVVLCMNFLLQVDSRDICVFMNDALFTCKSTKWFICAKVFELFGILKAFKQQLLNKEMTFDRNWHFWVLTELAGNMHAGGNT